MEFFNTKNFFGNEKENKVEDIKEENKKGKKDEIKNYIENKDYLINKGDNDQEKENNLNKGNNIFENKSLFNELKIRENNNLKKIK